MDVSQILSVLKLSWDLPWRIFASVSVLSGIAGIWIGGTALGFLAELSEWLGLDASVAATLDDAHTWIVNHAALPGLVGLLLEFTGLIFAGARTRSASRAPATVLVGATLATECGWMIPALGVIAALLVFWLAAAVVRIVYVARHPQPSWNSEVFLIEERLRRTWLGPIIATFYVPFAPLAWSVRA